MSVSANPMAMGANPFGALSSVAPRMTNRNMNVRTVSVTSAEGKSRVYDDEVRVPMAHLLICLVVASKPAEPVYRSTCDQSLVRLPHSFQDPSYTATSSRPSIWSAWSGTVHETPPL